MGINNVNEKLITIEEADLSVRAYNCLKRAGYNYIQELENKTKHDLMRIRNLNMKCIEEVIQTCNKFNVKCGDEQEYTDCANNVGDIYIDVIIYKGNVGKLIETRKGGNALAGNGEVKYRFYPAGYGSYYEEELEIVNNPEEEVAIAGSANGKEYAIKEFRKYNKDSEYIAINDRYQIIIGKDGKYYPHIKYISTSRAFSTLEAALIGTVVYDKVNTEDLHLNKYIFKLLDMEW